MRYLAQGVREGFTFSAGWRALSMAEVVAEDEEGRACLALFAGGSFVHVVCESSLSVCVMKIV